MLYELGRASCCSFQKSQYFEMKVKLKANTIYIIIAHQCTCSKDTYTLNEDKVYPFRLLNFHPPSPLCITKCMCPHPSPCQGPISGVIDTDLSRFSLTKSQVSGREALTGLTPPCPCVHHTRVYTPSWVSIKTHPMSAKKRG